MSSPTRYRVTCHPGNGPGHGSGTITAHVAQLDMAMKLARALRDETSGTVTVEQGARCVAVCTALPVARLAPSHTYTFVRSGGPVLETSEHATLGEAASRCRELADREARGLSYKLQVQAQINGIDVVRVWSGEPPVFVVKVITR